MAFYLMEIRNGSKSTYRQKNALKRGGFIFDGKYWCKSTDLERECVKWENFCRYRGLSFKAIGDNTERSNHYRSDFFAHHKPMFGKMYACAYCGKRLYKNQVQVDHIIAVNLAKKDSSIRKRIQILGWDSINDYRNLCAACSSCNRKKSDKGGLWIIRGRLGKRKDFQIFLLTMRIILSVAFGILVGLQFPVLGGIVGTIALLFVLNY